MIFIEKLNNAELLKYIKDNDILDLPYLQEQMEMKKRDELLSHHQGKITQGKDGKWRTYVKDDSKERGYRLIKKTTKEKLEDEKYERIIEIIKSNQFKKEVEGLGGYDTKDTGKIMAIT